MNNIEKELDESLWSVSLTTAGSAQQPPQEIERNFEAPDQNVAVTRAAGMYPNQKITQATVKQLDPSTRAPTMVPQGGTQNALGQLPIRPGISGPVKVGENINPSRFSYPYSITLPAAFAPIMEAASPVPVKEHYGQYHIELRNENDMTQFIRKLLRHRDKQSTNVIFNGLRSTYS